jgi:hypothetical protein
VFVRIVTICSILQGGAQQRSAQRRLVSAQSTQVPCGLVLIFKKEIVVMLNLCEVQIKRSLGNNVVKVEDVQHLLSVSLVQTNLIHANPAVFLNRRPMLGRGKPDTSHC